MLDGTIVPSVFIAATSVLKKGVASGPIAEMVELAELTSPAVMPVIVKAMLMAGAAVGASVGAAVANGRQHV
jgi:hypothetical protein